MALLHTSVTFSEMQLKAPRESVPRDRRCYKRPISQGLGPNTGLVHHHSVLLDRVATEPAQSQRVRTQPHLSMGRM